jgi:hypothetical protein
MNHSALRTAGGVAGQRLPLPYISSVSHRTFTGEMNLENSIASAKEAVGIAG